MAASLVLKTEIMTMKSNWRYVYFGGNKIFYYESEDFEIKYHEENEEVEVTTKIKI